MEMITPQEKQELEKKLEALKAMRPVLSKRIAEARALGDLRENADYHAAREDQGLNEAEIRRIENRLKSVKVADGSHVPEDLVFIGTTVRLRDLDDDSLEVYKLVGEASGNFELEYIEVTMTSPMGQALVKMRVGEVVKVDLPRGIKRFEVVAIL